VKKLLRKKNILIDPELIFAYFYDINPKLNPNQTAI